MMEPESEKKFFYFVRHGETDWNKQNTALGHLDISINADGRNQAQELKGILAPYSFDKLISSDLKRAQDTAVIITEGRGQEIATDSRLRARDWGELTGKASTLLYITNPELFECVESSESIEARVFNFLDEFIASHPHDRQVLVVCHGSVMRVSLSKILGFELKGRIVVRNTAYLKMSFWKGKWKLEEIHDIELPTSLRFKANPMEEERPTTLYFFRQGETDWSQAGIIEGQKDIPLNYAGKEQMRWFRKQMGPFPYHYCYTSDSLRAEMTGGILKAGSGAQIIRDPRLRERSWGDWEGRLAIDLKRTQGSEMDGVEAPDSVARRFFDWMNEMATVYPEGKRILVVTHTGVLRVLIASLLGFNDLDAEIGINALSFVKVILSEGRWRVERMENILLPMTIKFD